MAGETPIVLEGGLTRDPELAFAASGTAHARFGVAVGTRRKSKDGQWEDGETAFWDCVAFRSLAEHITETLHKGDRVIVVGTLSPEKYEKDGQERRSLKVLVDNIGPSLLFATANVTRTTPSTTSSGGNAQRGGSTNQGGWGSDPWASGDDDVPF